MTWTSITAAPTSSTRRIVAARHSRPPLTRGTTRYRRRPARARATGRGGDRRRRSGALRRWRAGRGRAWARTAVRAGLVASRVSRRVGVGAGSIIGGRVTLLLDPGALSGLAVGRRIVVVSGTNGKTTTSHLLAAALRTSGPVAHNATGTNWTGAPRSAPSRPPSAQHWPGFPGPWWSPTPTIRWSSGQQATRPACVGWRPAPAGSAIRRPAHGAATCCTPTDRPGAAAAG